MTELPGWFVAAACFPRPGSGLCEQSGPASSFLLSLFHSADSSDASLLRDLSPTAAAVLPLCSSHQNSTPSLGEEEWAGHAGEIKKNLPRGTALLILVLSEDRFTSSLRGWPKRI